MIKNHFKTAWRNSTRNKLSTTINIAGLALGFASVLLISLYVGDEQSYDRFFTNADRIYQVNMDLAMGGQAAYVSNTPPTAGPGSEGVLSGNRNVYKIVCHGRPGGQQ